MSVAKPDKGNNAKARTVEMPLLCSFNGFDAVNWQCFEQPKLPFQRFLYLIFRTR